MNAHAPFVQTADDPALIAASYISSIISAAGGKNLFASEKNPYPILNMEALIMTDPDLILVMNSVDKDYLCEVLKDFPSAGFVRKKNIFVTGDTTVPYYSPGKYVESVELIAKIIAGMNR